MNTDEVKIKIEGGWQARDFFLEVRVPTKSLVYRDLLKNSKMLPKISVSQRFFLKIHEFCPQISGRPWLATKKSVKTFYRRSLDTNFYDILRRKTPILSVLLHHCMLFRYKISQKSSIFNLKSLVYRDFVYWCQGPDQISGLQRISAVYPPP